MRGGVSIIGLDIRDKVLSSPRAWGCFREKRYSVSTNRVFPTCVGVFLSIFDSSHFLSRLPHVRGGVSARLI